MGDRVGGRVGTVVGGSPLPSSFSKSVIGVELVVDTLKVVVDPPV